MLAFASLSSSFALSNLHPGFCFLIALGQLLSRDEPDSFFLFIFFSPFPFPFFFYVGSFRRHLTRHGVEERLHRGVGVDIARHVSSASQLQAS